MINYFCKAYFGIVLFYLIFIFVPAIVILGIKNEKMTELAHPLMYLIIALIPIIYIFCKT